tara:strand:- start:1110 stop:1664 length:555 start_codon:yes stop_codon:yes gene_type:complete
MHKNTNHTNEHADGYKTYITHRKRRVTVTNEALSNPDVLTCILRGNVGPSTFAAVSEVSRGWRAVCRSDITVVRAVALYQGGLTMAKLMHLFAITQNQAKGLPHTAHARYDGGTCYLYSAPAVDALLSPSGMEAWRLRLHARAESSGSPFKLWPPPPCPPRRAPWQEEARLHAANTRHAIAAGR